MKYHKLCTLLAEAPDGQMDKSIASKFKAFIDSDVDPTENDIKQIIGECVYAGLASGFVMQTLETFLDIIKQRQALNNDK